MPLRRREYHSRNRLPAVDRDCLPVDGRCVIACENDIPAELCKDDWFWDCYYIDDPDAMPLCGEGATGTCSYSAHWHDGTHWVTCAIIGPGCNPDDLTVDCGVAHKCYDID